jgi:hypothetical protein
MTVDPVVVERLLAEVGLRRTNERSQALRLSLERPGWSSQAVAAALAATGADVHWRTVHRLHLVLASPAGAWARFRCLGPRWTCWRCGRAIEAADPACAEAALPPGVLPLELGGYCGPCLDSVAAGASDEEPLTGARLPVKRSGRRAVAVPIRALYDNPNLQRELLGSERRVTTRDNVVASLALQPRLGPRAIQESLDQDLPVAPSLRTVQRYWRSLTGPKARILFASLGAVPWTCTGCDAWGQVANPGRLRQNAPPHFALTDVRGLCGSCHQNVVVTQKQSTH